MVDVDVQERVRMRIMVQGRKQRQGPLERDGSEAEDRSSTPDVL